MSINFYAPVTINIIAFMVAPKPQAIERVEPLQIAEPVQERLYRADVEARANELYARPYLLTLDMRREIAEQIDSATWSG